jgi:ketosteroid isomerase-like protein
MKMLSASAAFLLLTPTAIAQQVLEKPSARVRTDKTANAEQEILSLEEERRQAILHNDAAAMDRLLAGEFIRTDFEGRTHDRADELSLYRNNRRQTQSWQATDVKVRVYGDAAVVTERVAAKDVLDGQPRDAEFRFTHVWAKRDGRWQLVARHGSHIPQPPDEAQDEVQAVRALDEQFEDAYRREDLTSRQAMTAEDYVGIGVGGTVFAKTTARDFFKSGRVKTLGHEITDRKVRVYGDTAVVTGTRHIRDTLDGKPRDEQHRYTRVWVKRNGQWLVVSFQATKVTAP